MSTKINIVKLTKLKGYALLTKDTPKSVINTPHLEFTGAPPLHVCFETK